MIVEAEKMASAHPNAIIAAIPLCHGGMCKSKIGGLRLVIEQPPGPSLFDSAHLSQSHFGH